ncbi:MAG: hypothetical protein AAF493_17945 [Pseudomonadota bacterium]
MPTVSESSTTPTQYQEHRERIETLMNRVQQSRDARRALMRDPDRVLASWGIQFPEDSRPIKIVDLSEVNLITLPPSDMPESPIQFSRESEVSFVRHWWGVEVDVGPALLELLLGLNDRRHLIRELTERSRQQVTHATFFGNYIFAERESLTQFMSEQGAHLRAPWIHITAGLWWLASARPLPAT